MMGQEGDFAKANKKDLKVFLFGWTGRIFIQDRSQETKIESKLSIFLSWLDRQDSNLRMLGPKPSALPLGDGPVCYYYNTLWYN